MDAGNTNVDVVGADTGGKPKERFYVDLTPGQTNIISLKKLRREAGEAVSDDSSEKIENEAERYIFVKLPKKKSSGALAIRDKVQHKTKGNKFLGTAAESAIPLKGNLKSKLLECKKDFQKRIKTSGGVLILKKHSYSSSKLNPGKNVYFTTAAHHDELHSRNSTRTNIKQQSKIGRKEHAVLGTASVNMKGTPKSGNEMLDLSILQLKMLAEQPKTPLIDVQGANNSLPEPAEIQLSPELKEKLGKVARSTELNEGKISEELIDRLMDILGKYLKRKILKRILREMILEDLYAIKAARKNFKQIKKELVKMIKWQAPILNIMVPPTPELSLGPYRMGDNMEDKLCELYDSFIQGIEEDDIGPSVVRRLFAKLADLWPKGTMDRHEIQKAISRAKERSRAVPSRQ